jgi:hypothetical protein
VIPDPAPSPTAWTITVPVDVGLTSPNLRRYWLIEARAKKAARTTAAWAWIAAGRPRAHGQVLVSVVVRRARAMDEGNVWAALKPVIDGLFVNALTPDDSPRWVKLGTLTQEISLRYRGREECVFRVESVA